MATLTKEQVEQKLQQLKQLAEELKALTKELVEAGAIELSEEDLNHVTGGCGHGDDLFVDRDPVGRKEPPIDFMKEPGAIMPPSSSL